MWCLWCGLWFGVVGGRGVFRVSHAEFSLAPERFTKETVGPYPFQV